MGPSFQEKKQAAYAAIERRYLCEHSKRETRRRVIADGRISYVAQCVLCGHTSNPIAARAALAKSPSPPPYDRYMEERRRQAKHAEYKNAFLALRPALVAEYHAYLSSAGWRQRRNAALVRAERRCEICPNPASQVHHLTYARVGCELPNDLMALCSECHKFIHAHIGV